MRYRVVHSATIQSERCRAVHSAEFQRYSDCISGPLLDRIDIHVEVPDVKYQDHVGVLPASSPA
jgi:predicted ATPase with chaperone activity